MTDLEYFFQRVMAGALLGFKPLSREMAKEQMITKMILDGSRAALHMYYLDEKRGTATMVCLN